MVKISITLPSLYPDALERALTNLDNATCNEIEVVVVSPFRCERTLRNGRVKWIEETTSTGCNAAHMAAIAECTGDFVQGWVDDHYFVDGWDVLAIKRFTEREAFFGGPFCLGLRHVWPRHVGTEFGIYYPYFPFMRLSTVHELGWLTSDYRRGFADSDLAFRVWAAGGRCEWSDHGLITVHPDDNRKKGVIFDASDMTLFLERWAPRYGKGWDLSKLRGFNMDVVPEDHPQVVNSHSIFFNVPEFRQMMVAGGWLE